MLGSPSTRGPRIVYAGQARPALRGSLKLTVAGRSAGGVLPVLAALARPALVALTDALAGDTFGEDVVVGLFDRNNATVLGATVFRVEAALGALVGRGSVVVNVRRHRGLVEAEQRVLDLDRVLVLLLDLCCDRPASPGKKR
jgi:hypothetical protein